MKKVLLIAVMLISANAYGLFWRSSNNQQTEKTKVYDAQTVYNFIMKDPAIKAQSFRGVINTIKQDSTRSKDLDPVVSYLEQVVSALEFPLGPQAEAKWKGAAAILSGLLAQPFMQTATIKILGNPVKIRDMLSIVLESR